MKASIPASSTLLVRVVGSAVSVVFLSFLITCIPIMGYAFYLAFQTRGAPDQAAINHFAKTASPKLIPLLEMILTFALALRAVRSAQEIPATAGIAIGMSSGLLSLGFALMFGARLGLHSLTFFSAVVLLGWMGAYVGKRSNAQQGPAS